MTERPPGLDDLLDHVAENMDTVEAARQLREALPAEQWRALVFHGYTIGELLDRIDRYEKNLPSWRHGTPEDVDAWLRDLIPDDKRLAFYQWIGAMAVKEALDGVRESLSNDPREPHARHYHRDDVEELLDLADPTQNDPYPAKLPVGRPFCDVDHHAHPNGGGRLSTCRLDSPE